MNGIHNKTLVLGLLLGLAGCTAHASVRSSGSGGGSTSGDGQPTTTRDRGDGQPTTVRDRDTGEGTTARAATDDPAATETPPEATSPSHPPIRCAGQEELTVEGVRIATSGEPAVRASGQCQLTLVGVTLEAQGAEAIVASGNARVELRDCTVTSTEAAIRATGNAAVGTGASRLHGPVDSRGNAAVGQALPTEDAPGRGRGRGRGR